MYIHNPSQWRHMTIMASPITDNSSFNNSFSGQQQIKYQNSALLPLCEGNPPVSGGFSSQRDSNVENVSVSRHHQTLVIWCLLSWRYTMNTFPITSTMTVLLCASGLIYPPTLVIALLHAISWYCWTTKAHYWSASWNQFISGERCTPVFSLPPKQSAVMK